MNELFAKRQNSLKEINCISQDLDWERGLLYADTHVAIDMDVEADVAEIKAGTEAEVEIRMEKKQLKKKNEVYLIYNIVLISAV